MQFGDQFDVSPDGPPGEQRRVLEHVADRVAVDIALAAGVGLQAGGDAQQRRLAAARRPHDGDELASIDADRHVVERVCAVGEDHRQVREFERM